MIRFLLIFHFILTSIRLGVAPWRFFQLNGNYFNEEKGLFSKLDIDRVIPKRFYLEQKPDDGVSKCDVFPVFVKPEWGQNSNSVVRADSQEMLDAIRRKCKRVKSKFILQKAAPGAREYEIFYIRSHEDFRQPAIFSITETENIGEDLLPVNSVNNPFTRYRDRTGELSSAEKCNLWSYLEDIGAFRIARVGLRANSITDMLKGKFKIIEINIFLPMPLCLLDDRIDFVDKNRFIIKSMEMAVRMVRAIPDTQKSKRIFFRKVQAHYRVKT